MPILSSVLERMGYSTSVDPSTLGRNIPIRHLPPSSIVTILRPMFSSIYLSLTHQRRDDGGGGPAGLVAQSVPPPRPPPSRLPLVNPLFAVAVAVAAAVVLLRVDRVALRRVLLCQKKERFFFFRFLQWPKNWNA